MENVHSKLFITYLDDLLNALSDVGAPIDLSDLHEVTNGFNSHRLTEKLIKDNFAEWYNETETMLNITADGIVFLHEGGYKHLLKVKRMNYKKTKTDFIKNVIFLIALASSIIVNLLYLFGVISFNFSSIVS